MSDFDDAVARAVESLPLELARRLENIAVVIEVENADEPQIFGLFQQDAYLPAKISIYRRPLERAFADPAALEREIRVTVLHELAHYFGLDEDRLAELGYE